MPINYTRRLTGKTRSASADRHLGFVLAFIAGAINAGGFLAVQQYTSHMTGVVSSMADHLVLGQLDLALGGAGALLAFGSGAACCAVMVNHARQRDLHSEYALPLLLEALLLLCFGLVGARLSEVSWLTASATVVLLSFIMGLQNAVITKLSKADIRTTHVTGIVTDIGIELGKRVFRSAAHIAPGEPPSVRPERLRVLAQLLLYFLVGGISGAVGFKYIGYAATLPLALLLIGLALAPLADDMVRLMRTMRDR